MILQNLSRCTFFFCYFQADKKIHEQLLGWVWHAPPRDVFLSFGSVISSQRKAHARISGPMEDTNEQGTGGLFSWLISINFIS